MRLYAERPVRAARQVLADVLVVLWVVLVVDVARAAGDMVLRFQGPAEQIAGAGESIRGTFDGAAGTAARLPLVGDDLAGAFGRGTEAGESLASSGRDAAETVAGVASGVTLAVAVAGVVPIVVVWLVLRGRWVIAARSALAVRTHDTDLLALRALAHQPVRRLLAVTPDPAAAWRRDDRTAVHGLAALELRALGLRAPRTPPD